jgi:branched-chain amino acid transport system ATP-binding protein
MLAIARALCVEPKVLLLDEPTEGLQPSMVTLIQDAVLALRDQGVAIVLVEQRVDAVLRMAEKVAFMEHGRIADIQGRSDLAPRSSQFAQYVGV